ncbi:MAG TPA: lipid A biosynthesis acyltransferase [Burkholderiaceae bacterium]|nr:lipid A biosynthesis acyltransferase [Burkholderiaceae bacterium]
MTAWLARRWIAVILATLDWPVARRMRLARRLGDLLWLVVWPRRRVTLANLRACFPEWSAVRRSEVGRQLFRNIARAALDHAVLWRGNREQVIGLVRVEGLERLRPEPGQALILLAPHFAGLDAGGIRIGVEMQVVSIYARQSNPVWDEWLTMGRARFNAPVLIARGGADLRPALRAMRDGLPFYYLPDMDHGPANSIFAPFFGVQAATIPMVSRLARIAGARVVLAVTEMTDDGYVLHLEEPWADFPGSSIELDTARMNREIERWVRRIPDQYLWTHRRFKTRPPGEAPFY